MRRLWLRFLVYRRRAHEREERYGWLFPVLAPFVAIVVIGATLSLPVMAHWRAVSVLRNNGGMLLYHTPNTYHLLPDTLLVEVERVSLTGRHMHDEMLEYVAALRGLEEVHLTDTSITQDAIDTLKRNRPRVTVIKLH